MTAPLSAQTAVEGRYLLDAPLDGWGLGEAWQCRDKNFRNRPVVLKFLPAERAERLAEAAQELRAQRALKHPCVLPVINQGTHAGRAWVAYDGFDGAPLPRLLDEQRRARGALDAAAARELFGRVLDAVAAGHEAATPVLHGCLQPACVLAKGAAVKVVDFGLHPFAPPGALGPFRAPELAAEGAAPTLASDVYALGATLADLLLPQQGAGDPRRALEALLASLQRDGAQAGRMQRADVALALWDAIARATRRDPAARWDDVSALRAALDAAWDAAPLAPARASAAPSLPQAPAFAQPQAPAPLAAPLPSGPAFSATMPPLAAPLPPPVAPAAAFLRPATMAPAPAPALRPPAPVAAWDAPPPSYPSTPPGDAWSTTRPPVQRAVEPVLASAWDPPAPSAVPAPPPWSAGSAAPLSPGPLAAGARAARDDEWDEETKAADPSRASGVPGLARPRAVQESTMALDVEALAGGLPPLPSESTMALDVDALAAAAAPLPPPPRASRPSHTARLEDDWKDSVVVLDTASGNTELASGLIAGDDEEEPYEPGARTRMAPAPAEVMETMETLQPRRNLAVEAYLASAHPIPTAERTMALDLETAPDPAFATVPAPMGRPPAMAPLAPQAPAGGPMYGLPPAQRPSAPHAPAFQPPPAAAPSKAPIIAAAVASVLLVGGALAFVLLR